MKNLRVETSVGVWENLSLLILVSKPLLAHPGPSGSCGSQRSLRGERGSWLSPHCQETMPWEILSTNLLQPQVQFLRQQEQFLEV